MKFQSIRGKLQFFLIIIIALLIVSFLFTYFSRQTLGKLDTEIINQQKLVSDIYKDLDYTQNLLERYMKSGYVEDYRIYSMAYSELLRKTFEFEGFSRSEETKRDALDFRYQIESYTEEANTAVSYRRDGQLILANEHFVETINLVGIIKNNFRNVFTIIMSDMEMLSDQSARNNNRNLFINLIALAIIITLSFLIMIILIRSLAKPIGSLTKAAEQIAEGYTDIAPVPVVSDDELKIMTIAFNKMMSTIQTQIEQLSHQKELEQKLLKEELALQKKDSIIKETELKALQSRINPHFLFNTLNMITQMAYLEEADKTSPLLEALSSMLRYNLETFHKSVTLHDELQNLQDYLAIQRLRFEDRISFDLQWDEEIIHAKLPCLILQPLVENSINHGLKETLESGNVLIKITRGDGRLIILVSDNGIGISYDEQKKIRKKITESHSDDEEGIGLFNVYQRLNLFFDGDIDFFLASIPGKGTEIRMELPRWS